MYLEVEFSVQVASPPTRFIWVVCFLEERKICRSSLKPLFHCLIPLKNNCRYSPPDDKCNALSICTQNSFTCSDSIGEMHPFKFIYIYTVYKYFVKCFFGVVSHNIVRLMPMQQHKNKYHQFKILQIEPLVARQPSMPYLHKTQPPTLQNVGFSQYS